MGKINNKADLAPDGSNKFRNQFGEVRFNRLRRNRLPKVFGALVEPLVTLATKRFARFTVFKCFEVLAVDYDLSKVVSEMKFDIFSLFVRATLNIDK